MLLDLPPWGKSGPGTRRAMALAAREGKTLAVATYEEAAELLADLRANLIVRVDGVPADLGPLEGAAMAEMLYAPGVMDQVARLKELRPDLVVAVAPALGRERGRPGRRPDPGRGRSALPAGRRQGARAWVRPRTPSSPS